MLQKFIGIFSGCKQISALEVWHVRWTSRSGEYSQDTAQQVEAFLSIEQATEFADSLRAAFKLLRHTSGTGVTITKSGYQGVD